MTHYKKFKQDAKRIPHYRIELVYNDITGEYEIKPSVKWSYSQPRKWFNYEPEGNHLVYPMYWDRERAATLLVTKRLADLNRVLIETQDKVDALNKLMERVRDMDPDKHNTNRDTE
jgi:hypothetical protein